jgi:hypothetical protein
MRENKIDSILAINDFLTECKISDLDKNKSIVVQSYLTSQINEILYNKKTFKSNRNFLYYLYILIGFTIR